MQSIGMTDKQFDSYKAMLLEVLEEAQNDPEKLSKLIAQLRKELQNP
jgi:hypothetical protein